MADMTEQEYYSKLYKHISKEMVVNMFKVQIRTSFPEPLASYYCKQIDDAKTFASVLDYYSQQLRQ
jgi:hypothetical protein